MYQLLLLHLNTAMSFNGFFRHLTVLDIILFVIIAFLVVSLITVAANNKSHLDWSPDKIIYRFVLLIVNAVICFIGYFVNALAFFKIFHIPNMIVVNDGLLVGLIAFLIISLINVTVNIKIYRYWNPDGSYKNIRFLIPIFAYILFDVFLPLYQAF